MADLIKSGITISPSTGTSGTTTISINASVNYGYANRVVPFTLSGDNVSETYGTLYVRQSGHTQFVSTTVTSYTIDAASQTVNISGTSNAEGLAISSSENNGSAMLDPSHNSIKICDQEENTSFSSKITSGTITTSYGSATVYNGYIGHWANNQGKTDKYDWTLPFVVTANTGGERKFYVYVAQSSGTTLSAVDGTKAIMVQITQEASEVKTAFSTKEYSTGSEESTGSATVTSNTDWAIQ